jgi:surfeit locus 1 family protein
MKRWVLIVIAAFATVGFGALGVWQVERRAWKLALIERVEERVHAGPVGAPGPAEWPGITRDNAEYLRVTATGQFLYGQQTLVRAVTDFGEGFWVMVPLRTERGFIVLVNRGFVSGSPQSPGGLDGASGTASGILDAASGTLDAASGTVTVTGLLRMSEPKGAFLRSNAPAEHRWYSRDVDAISHAQHLTGTAPYFIDAQASAPVGPESGQQPIAGLTVVHFRNSHLQFALTWLTLAMMALALGVRVARSRR